MIVQSHPINTSQELLDPFKPEQLNFKNLILQRKHHLM